MKFGSTGSALSPAGDPEWLHRQFSFEAASSAAVSVKSLVELKS
jgi:hypothetical protein